MYRRKGFEMVDVSTGAREEILTMDCEPSDVQVGNTIWLRPLVVPPIFETPPRLSF